MARQRPPQPWSQSQLQSDSKTLKYEFDMLYGVAANIFRARNAQEVDWASHNAHVESFAVHARNLIFFFYAHDERNRAGKPKPGDILAVDYFPRNSDWERLCDGICQTLMDAKGQADKQVAHITEERRELNQPSGPTAPWPIVAILKELQDLMLCFLNNVPKDNLAPGVEANLRESAQGVLGSIQTEAPRSRLSETFQGPSSPVNIEGKTDVRTLSPQSPGMFGMQGRTEP